MPEEAVVHGGGRSAAEKRREKMRGNGRWRLAGQRKKREKEGKPTRVRPGGGDRKTRGCQAAPAQWGE